MNLDASGFIFEEIDVAPLIEEKTSRKRKLPPCRFDLGSLDLKAGALPIELAGPGTKAYYTLQIFFGVFAFSHYFATKVSTVK